MFHQSVYPSADGKTYEAVTYWNKAKPWYGLEVDGMRVTRRAYKAGMRTAWLRHIGAVK